MPTEDITINIESWNPGRHDRAGFDCDIATEPLVKLTWSGFCAAFIDSFRKSDQEVVSWHFRRGSSVRTEPELRGQG